MIADPTTLPQRTPGASLADACSAVQGGRGISGCQTDRACDWHWARQHVEARECGCCVGRYSGCRNLPEPRTLVETVEHLLNTLGVRELAQHRQNQQQEDD